MSDSTERSGRALAAMVVATALWGATFVVIRDAVAGLHPVTLVCGRFLVAAALLGAIAVAVRARFDRPAWRAGLGGGVCAAGGFLFQAIGLQHTTAGSSAFLTSTGTLMAALFAWPLLGQRPGARLAAGLALATAGAALLPSEGGFRFGPGEVWTLAGALAFALQIVAVARDAPRAHPLAIAAVQAATVALVTAPFLPPGGLAAWTRVDAGDAARLAYLAVAGSAVAPVLQLAAQRAIPPGRIGLLFALEPVFALAFAVTVGAERYAGSWWLGAALVLAGVAWVEWRAARALDPPRGP